MSLVMLQRNRKRVNFSALKTFVSIYRLLLVLLCYLFILARPAFYIIYIFGDAGVVKNCTGIENGVGNIEIIRLRNPLMMKDS